jgi:hypothetical protein
VNAAGRWLALKLQWNDYRDFSITGFDLDLLTTGSSLMANTVTYVPRPQPTLGGDALFLQQELAAISQSIKTIVREIEQLKALLAANGIT